MEKNPFKIMKYTEPHTMKLEQSEFAKAGQIQQNTNIQKTEKTEVV